MRDTPRYPVSPSRSVSMSTYVVSFVGEPLQTFRGKVKHVSTGEEIAFSTVGELVEFFEAMNVASGASRILQTKEQPEKSAGR